MPVGAADQHEAAADIAAARIDDGQRITDRDSSIDSVAAGLQDCQPGVARLVLCRHHHAMPGFNSAFRFVGNRGRGDKRKRE